MDHYDNSSLVIYTSLKTILNTNVVFKKSVRVYIFLWLHVPNSAFWAKIEKMAIISFE